MEPRILLSKDLIGSTRERLHAALPSYSAASPSRIASPEAHHHGHAAHTRHRRGVTTFAIPGAPGQSVEATFTLTARRAAYHNEEGLFLVDDATGRIGALHPGDRGYAAAALARRQVLFTRKDRAGAVAHVQLPAGAYFGMYLIQNSSSRRFLRRNPHDRLARGPRAFFSFAAANPDHFRHLHERPGNILRWEDMTHGGDCDFNDAVLKFSVTPPPPPPIPPLSVTLALDPSTDSAPVGDDQTTFASVLLVGQTTPDLPVTLVETGATVTADASGHFEFSGVPLAMGANAFHVQVEDTAGDTGSASLTITRIAAPCVFNDLTGWTVNQTGGTGDGQGSVGVAGDHVVLREGNSFDVTLSKTFTVPKNPGTLEFDYTNLNFDTTAQNMIKDAFEAALVDSKGQPLVHPYTSNRDAFFNISEGVPAVAGPETTIDGHSVTVNLSSVTPGTQATLILRLVNNDTDHNSSVAVTCVHLPDGAASSPAANQIAGNSSSFTTTAQAVGTTAPPLPSGGAVAAVAPALAPGSASNTSQSGTTSGGVVGSQAQTPPITVKVGYADNLRASPYYPNPWSGSPNTVFVGENSSNNEDSGAILITNNESTSITVNDVSVTLPSNDHYDLWGSNVVPAGSKQLRRIKLTRRRLIGQFEQWRSNP